MKIQENAPVQKYPDTKVSKHEIIKNSASIINIELSSLQSVKTLAFLLNKFRVYTHMFGTLRSSCKMHMSRYFPVISHFRWGDAIVT